MKLFQLSLLWRASEATGEFFSQIKLKEEDSERLRQMLLTGDPGKEYEYLCAVCRLVVSPAMQANLDAHGIAIETGTYGPVTRDHGPWQTHQFLMGGLSWTFCVCPGGVPEIMLNTYITENGRFYLSQIDGELFLLQYSQKVVGAGNVTKKDAEESIRARAGLNSGA